MTVIKGALDSISLNVSLIDYVWFLPWILDVIKKKQEQKNTNKTRALPLSTKIWSQPPIHRWRDPFGRLECPVSIKICN